MILGDALRRARLDALILVVSFQLSTICDVVGGVPAHGRRALEMFLAALQARTSQVTIQCR